jgi:hypothetical protein
MKGDIVGASAALLTALSLTRLVRDETVCTGLIFLVFRLYRSPLIVSMLRMLGSDPADAFAFLPFALTDISFG